MVPKTHGTDTCKESPRYTGWPAVSQAPGGPTSFLILKAAAMEEKGSISLNCHQLVLGLSRLFGGITFTVGWQSLRGTSVSRDESCGLRLHLDS